MGVPLLSLLTATVPLTDGLKRRPGWDAVWLGSARPCPS
ncbi:hypothetical protein SFR_3454 [Streptomyces sp. FR-008]|nr:hypothetical protein SFR_3454 [Streptomyces sp. FR-008]